MENKSSWFLPGAVASIAAVAVIAGSVALAKQGHTTTLPYNFVSVERQNLISEISTDGILQPAQAVDLGFELPGKITSVKVKVGQSVKAGALLATVQSADLGAAVSQANAAVQAALARQAQAQAIVDGQTVTTQTSVESATKALEAAQQVADANSASKRTALWASAQTAAASDRNALLTITDLQFSHFNGYGPDDIRIAEAKEAAIQQTFGQMGAGHWDRASISALNGGIYATIMSTPGNAIPADFSARATTLVNALYSTNLALASVPQNTDLTAAELSALAGTSANINAQITALSAAIQAAQTQDATNESALTAAKAALTAAQNQVSNPNGASVNDAQTANAKRAQADLALARAGVSQAYASLAAASAQYSKATLKAPIAGVITAVNAKVGEFANPSVPTVSLMSHGALQIESYVAQTDIVHLTVGATAQVKVDGDNQTVYEATVVTVDPASTSHNGVDAYRVVLQVNKENDALKSGMHVNVHIVMAQKDNALTIPQSAVIRHGDQAYVFLKNHPKEETLVHLGMNGSNDRVEVLDGLQESDMVAVFGGVTSN